MKKLAMVLLGLAALTTGVPVAQAGGYDTPMLYSARHMGLGGAAAGYVNDPSALFHNPAGLGHTERLSLMLDVSPLLGNINGAPAAGVQTESETAVAPFFLLGANYRIPDWLVAGLAVYPVASAGATYRYTSTFTGAEVEDRTRLVFIEASPGVGFNLPGNVRLGVGYRLTYMTLERFQGDPNGMAGLDFELSGINAASFRAGVQWTAIEDAEDATGATRNSLEMGAAYRHRTVVDVSNDTGVALGQDFVDISSSFTLPSKFNAGVRYDYQRFGVVADFEYTLQSQNETSSLSGTVAGTMTSISVDNVFRWSDSITVRGGLEYRLLEEGQLALRAGYVYDGEVTNPQYPTAFGTPAAATQVITAGAGYDAGAWELNFAGAYRFGEATITEADITDPSRVTCQFCSAAGDYSIALFGLYLDFSYDLN